MSGSSLCVLCGRSFVYDSKDLGFFPFCSARCKGVDLANWVTEEYRFPGSPAPYVAAGNSPAQNLRPLPEDAEGPEEFEPEDEGS